ncbi:MAG: hypothetical protein HRT77_13820 [Halioglobus sp.]|nr:hypothetical protein [Halioglobus sp.]
MPIRSLTVTALPATLVTAALVLLMHHLIATDMEPPDIQDRRPIEFLSHVAEITPPDETRRPRKPPEVTTEPEPLKPQLANRDAAVGSV